MKTLLSISLIMLSLSLTAQSLEDWSFIPSTTDNNMSIVFPAPLLLNFTGGQIQAFDGNNNPVGNNFALTIYPDGSSGMAVMGIDSQCQCVYPSNGDELYFVILMNGETIVIIQTDPPLTYAPSGFEMVSSALTFRNVDGSCYADGDNDGVCDENEIPGCQESWADNYMPEATDNDNSCYKYGCTDTEATNYSIVVTDDDGSCVYFTPIEYQLTIGWNMVGYTGTDDNNEIVAQMDAALGNSAGTGNTFQVIKNVAGQFWSAAFAQISTFNQGEGYMMYVIGTPTTVNFQQSSGYISGIEYNLTAGWNIVAFTGDVGSDNNIVSSMDNALGSSDTENTFQVIKNVSGQFWSQAFAQITTFNPGQAYMMYVNGSITTVNFQQE